MKTQGIYSITHIATGRVYVGSAVNTTRRWWLHRDQLAKGTHHAARLQSAWSAFGSDAFLFSILEVVADKADLTFREQCWIDALDAASWTTGFNTCPNAGSSLGTRHSEQTKTKIRALKTGRIASPETRLKLSNALKGLVRSPETCIRLSKCKKGRIFTAETLARMSAGQKGRITSDETKAKLSAAITGCVRSPETRAKMSAAKKGYAHTAEARQRMSISQKARQMRKQLERNRSLQPDQSA